MKGHLDNVKMAVLARIDESPKEVAASIMEQYNIGVCDPLTPQWMETMMAELTSSLRTDVLKILDGRLPPVDSEPAAAATASLNASQTYPKSGPADEGWYDNFTHASFDRFNLSVPENYQMPTLVDVRKAWYLWHFGDRQARVRPFKQFKTRADFHTKKNQQMYSKMKYVMAKLPTPVATERPDASDESQFNAAFDHLTAGIYDKVPTNVLEVSYITVYDRLSRKRKAAEAQLSEDSESET